MCYLLNEQSCKRHTKRRGRQFSSCLLPSYTPSLFLPSLKFLGGEKGRGDGKWVCCWAGLGYEGEEWAEDKVQLSDQAAEKPLEQRAAARSGLGSGAQGAALIVGGSFQRSQTSHPSDPQGTAFLLQVFECCLLFERQSKRKRDPSSIDSLAQWPGQSQAKVRSRPSIVASRTGGRGPGALPAASQGAHLAGSWTGSREAGMLTGHMGCRRPGGWLHPQH